MDAKTRYPGLVDRYSGHNRTRLHIAASTGQLLVLHSLIREGQAVNRRTSEGITPLHEACGTNHVYCARNLIKAKAEVQMVVICSMYSNEECVRLLLDAGAQLELEDQHYGTALHCACEQSHPACVGLLLQSGSCVNFIVPQTHCSPLHLAAMRNNTKIIQLLMDYGATPFVKDKKQQYPCDLVEVDCDAASTLYKYHSNAVSLKQLCRLEIRKNIGSSHLDNLPNLDVPASLKSYLQYK
ncbi:ankyrin repeat and SOCS box protein 11-like isoform X2 [Antedon mediterranea]|uniref:ankyrin repeat and SOCS box protein 11-like isoform X2 n=1 Tax=Antedon mediterranea TaxID=105859 RepID=UPI003AF83665